jgi:mRNA interferase MazF
MNIPQFSVVTVPFPFTDVNAVKRRPALVLSNPTSFNDVIGHSVLAMITSSKNSPWPLDTEIKDLNAAGLPSPSKVRMKLFTLDHRLILSKLGKLSPSDEKNVRASLRKLIP